MEKTVKVVNMNNTSEIPKHDILEESGFYKKLEKGLTEQLVAGVVTSLRILLDEGCIKMFNPKTKKKLSKKKAHKELDKFVEDFYRQEESENE